VASIIHTVATCHGTMKGEDMQDNLDRGCVCAKARQRRFNRCSEYCVHTGSPTKKKIIVDAIAITYLMKMSTASIIIDKNHSKLGFVKSSWTMNLLTLQYERRWKRRKKER
jgi:hypothetical protein